MAGEIAGVNYNAMNDDFLAQMYFNRNAQNTAPSQQTQNVPASQTGVSNPAFQGGPQGDTFEKSSSLVPTVRHVTFRAITTNIPLLRKKFQKQAWRKMTLLLLTAEIGRASCRERV